MECTKKIIIIKIKKNKYHYKYSHLLKIASAINVKDAKFGYNSELGTFYPIQGKDLGSNIPVKHYDVPEFIYLLIFLNCEEIYLECAINVFKDIIKDGTFDSLQLIRDDTTIITIPDYPAMITHLEWLGLVMIKKSSSQMSSDGRIFSVIENRVANIATASDLIKTWYEVDFLGTVFGAEVTEKITSIYNEYFGRLKGI